MKNSKSRRIEDVDESVGPSEMNVDNKESSSETTPYSSEEEENNTVVESTDSTRKSYEVFESNRQRKRKRRNSKRTTITPSGTVVKNKFECLSDKNDDKTVDKEDDEPAVKTFPPIVVKTGLTLKVFIDEMKTHIKHGNEINFKSGRGTISIYTTTSDDFTTIQEKLKTKQYEFHTFSPKQDRIKRLVIKGISCEFTPTEVEEDLKKMGLDLIKVTNMFKAKKAPSNMFLVSFPKTTQLNTVLKSNKFKYICYQRVQWCKYIPPLTNQCHRCQRFGHSSSNCNHNHRCIKCTVNHGAEKCPKQEDEKPKCINCNGEHPANYRKCTNYINYVSKFDKKTKQNTNTAPVTVFRRPNISYSNMTKNITTYPTLSQRQIITTPQPQTNINANIESPITNTPRRNLQPATQTHTELPNNTGTFEEEINNLFSCSMEDLGTLLDEFLPRLSKIVSRTSKQMAVIGFLAQFK